MSEPVPSASRVAALRDVDPPLATADLLRPHRGRVLDPTNTVLLAGQQVRPTTYVADELLIAPHYNMNSPAGALAAAADQLDLELADARPHALGGVRASRITLRPKPGAAAKPDAWAVLQRARALAQPQPEPTGAGTKPPAGTGQPAETADLAGVGLNHLLSVMPGGVIGQYEPNGGAGTNAYYAGSTISQYSLPGLGGRTPVRFLGSLPARRSVHGRRPVVAILDMGCAEHPWLPGTGEIVDRAPRLDGRSIGLDETGDEVPFAGGPMDGRLYGLAGHGTYVCGLVRQVCPDANLISAKVVPPDGLLDEHALVSALADIYELVRRWLDGADGGRPVDVVSLSLGYYPEELKDPATGTALASVLAGLGRLGVVVVASVGNDATQRELYPAAWAAPKLEADSAPLVSVGAENPDGSIALFSNGGDWVRHWEPGVVLVSSMPSWNGGVNAAADSPDPSGRPRRSLDPDNYPAYASWCGTSFAAPVLAGRIAGKLLQASERATARRPAGALGTRDRAAAVARAQAAVQHCVPNLQ
ncbi:MAG TPA: S8/S53 family peptidase [Mycobacteriales bacterium]|nr:S8/S53 family peptidase [Mycobacteriales bacterium]